MRDQKNGVALGGVVGLLRMFTTFCVDFNGTGLKWEKIVEMASAADVLLTTVTVLVQLLRCDKIFYYYLLINIQTACAQAQLFVARWIIRMKQMHSHYFRLKWIQHYGRGFLQQNRDVVV